MATAGILLKKQCSFGNWEPLVRQVFSRMVKGRHSRRQR